MPHSCCMLNCTTRGKTGEISLHRIPKCPPDRREKWLKAISRADPDAPSQQWAPTASHRVCGKHFTTGKPHEDKDHPDYAPSLMLGYGGSVIGRIEIKKSSVRRLNLREKREESKREKNNRTLAAEALMELQQAGPSTELCETEMSKEIATQTDNKFNNVIHYCVRETMNLKVKLAEVQRENTLLKNKLTSSSIVNNIAFYTKVNPESLIFANCAIAQPKSTDEENPP